MTRNAIPLAPLFLVSLLACSEAHESLGESPLPPAQYVGAATDEALERLLALVFSCMRMVMVSPTQRARLSANRARRAVSGW